MQKLTIYPYKLGQYWVFDDLEVELVEEPFIEGADDIIDKMVVDLSTPENGFELIFSDEPFEGHQFMMDRLRKDEEGYWYYSIDYDMEGWLCPALFSYYQEAPKNIFIQVSDIKNHFSVALKNSIVTIHPYKYKGTWVFDDERVGLVREPFVAGADEMIDVMVKDIPKADKGFNLIFSGGPFPGYEFDFDRKEAEFGGTWYHNKNIGMRGWLCPALFKYFIDAPEKLFAQVRAYA